MSDFKFYKTSDIYREKYFQLPRIFFTSSKYKNMSNDSKIAYTLLKDRFDYSIQNNWVDSDNNIYFIFTVQELMSLLNCREGKISKIKKELEGLGLLYQKRQPPKIVNGKKEGQPNYLYLGKPEVTAADVYKATEVTPDSQIAKIAIQEKHPADNISPQIAKIAIQEDNTNSKDFSQIAKIANNLDNNFLDTLNTDTKEIDTFKDAALQNELLATFHLIQDQTFLSEHSLKFIALYAKTVEQAQAQLNIIYRAKKKAEKDKNKLLIAEDWHDEIDLRLRKVVHKIRTDHTIQQPDNYLFITFYHFFCERISELEALTNHVAKDLPQVSLYNYLGEDGDKV